jgi:CspA family cold shock protein
MCKDQYLKVAGKVKWFNQFKGYGFIEVEGIREDIFIHFSAIDQSGIGKLNNDDIIICDIAKLGKGFQVTAVLEIKYLNKYEIPGENREKIVATMKWFNPAKGFGFAKMPTGEDVFIHSNILKKHKLETIEHDTIVTLVVHRTNLGYEAIDIIPNE